MIAEMSKETMTTSVEASKHEIQSTANIVRDSFDALSSSSTTFYVNNVILAQSLRRHSELLLPTMRNNVKEMAETT